MKWEDIDFENKIWTVPLEDDKVKNIKVRNQIFLNSAAINLLKKVTKFPNCPTFFSNSYGRPYTDMVNDSSNQKSPY